MDSFYGGRKGQDFRISKIFGSKTEMAADLALRWQSSIGVGEYVIVSYGMANDPGYNDKRDADDRVYHKSYNSTLWEKIYTEEDFTEDVEAFFANDTIKRGIGYKLISAMTGNTPKFAGNVTVNPVSPDTPPSAYIDSTNVDSPKLILNIPTAQFMKVTNDSKDAGDAPTLTWVDEDPVTHKKLANPQLILHLPVSQKIDYKGAVREDADYGSRAGEDLVEWDDTDTTPTVSDGDPTNTRNSPELKFHFPRAQLFKDEHVNNSQRGNVSAMPEVHVDLTGNNADTSKKINEPELIFKLPVAQKIVWKGLIEELEAGETPVLEWKEDAVITDGDTTTEGSENRPTFGMKLPASQVLLPHHVTVNKLDAGKDPDVRMDVTGNWTAETGTPSKKNQPELIFDLPVGQKINFTGWSVANVLDANVPPRVEWDDTDDLTKEGQASDKRNRPELTFYLPQSQVMQQPTQVVVGPSIPPKVDDIGSVNKPKLQFTLPRAVKYFSINSATEKSTTYFTRSWPDAEIGDAEIGDYVLNYATGFMYEVSGKTASTITCKYMGRFAMYTPTVGSTQVSAYDTSASPYSRNQIKVERKFLDPEETQVQLFFTIPKQPNIELTVSAIAPLATPAISSATIKDADTLNYALQIPRGSRWYTVQNPSALNGDYYIDLVTGDVQSYNGSSWTIEGNIRGPVGDALNVVASFDLDNIGTGVSDTLANVSPILEQRLGVDTSDPTTYPKADELIKVTWTQKEIGSLKKLSETSYWYFYVPARGSIAAHWDRAQITAGLGDVIINDYSINNEDNKTYSIKYINKLIDDAATSDKDKKTYSINKIDTMTSWYDMVSGLRSPTDFYKGTTLPGQIKEGRIYLISPRGPGGENLGDNLFVDLNDSERVQLSAARLSKMVVSGSNVNYLVIEPEDIVTKSGITNLKQYSVLIGDTNKEVMAVDNAQGAFYSDGLGAPLFGTLPVDCGGTGNQIGKAPTAEKLHTPVNIGLTGVTATAQPFDGSANIDIPVTAVPASLITGVIDISHIPQGALERLVVVADEAARFALTTADVQLGDTVKQEDTGVMYYVKDEAKLDSEDGYAIYSAGRVEWDAVQNKPDLYNKTEVDAKVTTATVQSWEFTIDKDDWQVVPGGTAESGPFEYVQDLDPDNIGRKITCGKSGEVNPMIAPLPLDGAEEVNYKEWSKVTSAVADVDNNNITFRAAKKKPTEDLLISVIDFGSPEPTTGP